MDRPRVYREQSPTAGRYWWVVEYPDVEGSPCSQKVLRWGEAVRLAATQAAIVELHKARSMMDDPHSGVLSLWKSKEG